MTPRVRPYLLLAGFSLIELMVVVAIIGILATLGVSNYQKFKARAQQTSAKSELAGIFVVEKGFHAEYGTYHWELPSMGYVPEGVNKTNFLPLPRRPYATYAGTDPTISLQTIPQLGLARIAGYMEASGFASSADRCVAVAGLAMANRIGAVEGAFGDMGVVTNNTFSARAIGCPRENISAIDTNLDWWSIDENKVLSNLQSGI